MAKIKKRKLVWNPSKSPQVVGYKLYWSENGKVDYQSASTKLGNVTEIILPDDVAGFEKIMGPVELGITAVDELGNESDLITLKTPYQFNVPQAPADLWIETLQQYHTTAREIDHDHEKPEATIGQTGPKPVQLNTPSPSVTPPVSPLASPETSAAVVPLGKLQQV